MVDLVEQVKKAIMYELTKSSVRGCKYENAAKAAIEAAKQNVVVESLRAEVYGAIFRTHNGNIRNIDEVTDSVMDHIRPYLATQTKEG